MFSSIDFANANCVNRLPRFHERLGPVLADFVADYRGISNFLSSMSSADLSRIFTRPSRGAGSRPGRPSRLGAHGGLGVLLVADREVSDHEGGVDGAPDRELTVLLDDRLVPYVHAVVLAEGLG